MRRSVRTRPCLRRVPYRSEGLRFRQPLPVPHRPCDDHRTPHHQVFRDRALALLVQVIARIRRVRTVVPHDEEPAARHLHLELQLRGRIARMDVRLEQGRPVDRDPAVVVATLDRIPAGADHTFDQVLLVGRGQQADEGQQLLRLLDPHRVPAPVRLLPVQPAPRVLEDHHVAPLRPGPEPRRQLVHQHPVADLDGLFHRARRDDERLQEEGLQHQGDQQGHAYQDRHLLGGRPALPAPLDPRRRLPPGRPATGRGRRRRPRPGAPAVPRRSRTGLRGTRGGIRVHPGPGTPVGPGMGTGVRPCMRTGARTGLRTRPRLRTPPATHAGRRGDPRPRRGPDRPDPVRR